MKLVLGMEAEVGLSPGDFVLDGDPAPPQTRDRAPPQFSVHVYCGQTAGWIKMALDMEAEVGLSPGDLVFDGDPSPSPKRRQSPLPKFRFMSIVVKRHMDGSRWHLVWRPR